MVRQSTDKEGSTHLTPNDKGNIASLAKQDLAKEEEMPDVS